jgi:hypothetical protein
MRPQSDETKRKLNLAAARERRRGWLAMTVGAIILVLAGGAVIANSTTTSEREVTAKTERAQKKTDPLSGQAVIEFYATLGDGKRVFVDTLQGALPSVGDEVILREKQKLLGNRTYSWEGKRADAPK